MRSPSPRVKPHTATLYRYVPGQDSDAGAVASEASLIAAGVACAVQPLDVELDGVSKRIRQTVVYDVLLYENYSLKAKDLIVWTDLDGTTHNLYVVGQLPQAGLQAAWRVKAREVI